MESPIVVLQSEHKLLRQVIATTQRLQQVADDEVYHAGMQQILSFFRNFTELYHHPKEELIHNYLVASSRLSVSSEQMETIGYGREDLDQLMADMVDAHMFYDVASLRRLTGRYIAELSLQMENEELLVLKEAETLLTHDESEMIAREFLLQDNRDRLMQGILNNYYKFSSQFV